MVQQVMKKCLQIEQTQKINKNKVKKTSFVSLVKILCKTTIL